MVNAIVYFTNDNGNITISVTNLTDAVRSNPTTLGDQMKYQKFYQ